MKFSIFGRPKKNRRSKPQPLSRRKSKSRRMKGTFSMETLESRLALSVSPGTATLDSDELIVCGTDADNTIIVSESDGQIFVAADFLDEPLTFSQSEVNSITISGGDGADTLVATGLMMGATMEGEAGDDQIFGSGFADTIDGGEGIDSIFGDAGNDTISAGAGNDTVMGGAGDDTINGGDGDDTIVGDIGDDTIGGDGGEDTLLGGAGADNLSGGADDDLIVGSTGNDTMSGGDGNDQLVGDDGDDSITGDAGNDTVNGVDGNDTLNGGADDDVVVGGDGNDTIGGNDGDDTLIGVGDDDTITGGNGNDMLLGGSGNDDLSGEAGNDVLAGGDGDDTLAGDAGTDTLYGEAGDDEIGGGSDDDQGFGGAGDDVLVGDEGGDSLFGGPGVDVLSGVGGDDHLQGDDDRDVLIGGTGSDVLYGQGGEDVAGGGTTSIDSNFTQLAQLGQDWNSSDSYDTRLTDIQSRMSAAAQTDSAADFLAGQDGQDAFYNDGTEDDLLDQVTDEFSAGSSLVAVDDSYTLVAGQPLTTTSTNGLLANDVVGGGTQTVTVSTTPVSGPTNGTLTLNSDGSFTYTPNDATVVSDSFEYEISDGTTTSQATVNIAVEVSLTAVNDAYTVTEDNTLTVNAADGLLANDESSNPTSLTVTTTPSTPPEHGSVTIQSDGAFEYVPVADFHGTDSFEYTISDDTNESSMATVTITIESVNDRPVVEDQAYSVTADTAFSTTAGVNDLATLATDADDDTLTASVVQSTDNGTVSITSGGEFSYTPDAGFTGMDTFTYEVNDGVVDSSTARVWLNVTESVDNRFNVPTSITNDQSVGTVTAPEAVTGTPMYEFEPDAGRPEVLALNSDDHLAGDTAAPLLIIEYVDFQCPTCALVHPILQQMKTDFEGDLLVVTRHLPLSSIHANAISASRAAEAAGNQDQFDEMADLLFNNQSDWSSEADPTSIFQQYASDLGLDTTQFDTDYNSQETLDRIARDADEANDDLGISSTPTAYLNDEIVSTNSLLTEESFTTILQDELDSIVQPYSLDRLSGDIEVRDATQLDFANSAELTLDIVAYDESTRESVDVIVRGIAETGLPPLPIGGELVDQGSEGLQVYDFEVGTGQTPVRSDAVQVDYVGYLPNGTIFDSNSESTFNLTGVIQGFAEGIEGMQVGGWRRISIPPDLGYGSNGNAGAGIGGTDTIVFDVFLRGIS